MKLIKLRNLILLLIAAAFVSCVQTNKTQIAEGLQPQIAVDGKGITRIVYGREDEIYCVTSTDDGTTFSAPVKVGEVKDLGLGMSRGPQLASSANYTMVTAIGKDGNIHSFQLDHNANKWIETAMVNDVPDVALEGLMSIAADGSDNFFAVWLDLRDDHNNKICFSSTSSAGRTWSKNKIAYVSPDTTVCECCKPNLAVNQSKVAIMFRNWIDGSRDLYFITSEDKGQTFSEAKKLGNGTWKLKGCPMDGGGILVDDNSEVHTVWQREGQIFYAQPDQGEIQIADGRVCSIAGNENPVILWQNNSQLMVMNLGSKERATIGEGGFLKAVQLPGKRMGYAWEKEGTIQFRKL